MRRLVVAAVVIAAGCARDTEHRGEATGTLEYTTVDVAPLTSARVVRVIPKEGDSVSAGDTVVLLTLSSLRGDIDARRARLAAAEAQVRDLIEGPRRTEIQQAETEVRLSEEALKDAARELARIAPLVQVGGLPRQRLDAAQTAQRMAEQRNQGAQAALRTIQAGTRPERIAAARAEVQSARAMLDVATQAAADLVLTAPVGGVVVSRQVEVGEVVAPGMPLLTIGDVGHPYVRVYVGQEQLPLVRTGDRVTARLDAFPDRTFTGLVTAVSTTAEFTPRVALTKDERADLLFGVKVEFTDGSGMLKAGLPISVQLPSPRTAPP